MQALNETTREDAEWILWMDLDTVAVESDIAFPLADYEGRDLVLWIQPDLVMQGDAFRKPLHPELVLNKLAQHELKCKFNSNISNDLRTREANIVIMPIMKVTNNHGINHCKNQQ